MATMQTTLRPAHHVDHVENVDVFLLFTLPTPFPSRQPFRRNSFRINPWTGEIPKWGKIALFRGSSSMQRGGWSAVLTS
jgi:hypothetical protein